MLGISYRDYENTKIEIHNKIKRTCKDDPSGHGTRREKERQTEKEMARQLFGMGRFKVG